MNMQIWKFITTQLLIVVRSVFSTPVILTFLAAVITTIIIVFSGSNVEFPKWMPSNFSLNEGDFLRWWGYGIIILSFVLNIFRKVFDQKYTNGFLEKFGIYGGVLSIAYVALLVAMNSKDLIQENSILFYILWYVLMIIFLSASLFISFIMQKVELLQNKKPLT